MLISTKFWSEVELTNFDRSCSVCCLLISFLFHQIVRQPRLSCRDLLRPKMTISSLCGLFNPEGRAVSSSSRIVLACFCVRARVYLYRLTTKPTSHALHLLSSMVHVTQFSFKIFCNLKERLSGEVLTGTF